MALETLKNLKEIGGVTVRHCCEDMGLPMTTYLSGVEEPIWIEDDRNIIAFRIQKGPIKEVGINGVQVDTLIETALLIVRGLNEQFPCDSPEATVNQH